MPKVMKECLHCSRDFETNTADIKRGYGKFCTRTCSSKYRETKKKGYDPLKVARNNFKRDNWLEQKYGVYE